MKKKTSAEINRRRRRLLNEIIGASDQLLALDAQITHTPYPKDIPLLKKQRREMAADLRAARKDLKNL